MEDLAASSGTFVTLVVVVAIAWAVMWFFVPFMVYSIHENMKRIAKSAERTAREAETMRKIQEADVLDLGKKDRAA